MTRLPVILLLTLLLPQLTSAKRLPPVKVDPVIYEGIRYVAQVSSKTRAGHASDETSAPRLRGDALLVEKSEAASALIYWNGKRYVWSQQGDQQLALCESAPA